MKKNTVSTISEKGQTTIPVSVRKALRLDKGDTIGYLIEGSEVKLRKIQKIDKEWSQAIESTLTEWNGTDDDDL
ncbi:MAG: type II toxin-antitoxin system PrlF family antitoxin [Spirochaetes bacterium]|nr:type II toxin-antitoxin system PrlF family antitoxin [Spirochaetota bacterium]